VIRTTCPTLQLEQEVRYAYPAPIDRLQQRMIVVPPAGHGPQRRDDWSFTVAGVPSPVQRTRTDRFGNTVIDVAAHHVEHWIRFASRVTVSHAGADADAAGAGAWETAADPRYRRPTALTTADAAVRALVGGGAGAGAGAEPAALCARTHRALTYQWGITGVRTSAARALAGGRGVCQDYAHVMIAACRAAGIEARYVSGHLVGEGGSHAWVEVLLPHPQRPDRRVVEAWDPTHDCRTDHRYLTIAVGRDYADVAPLSGSYVAPGVTGQLTVHKRLQQVPATTLA
jgi:transglutaminase-like putative cysteine protease